MVDRDNRDGRKKGWVQEAPPPVSDAEMDSFFESLGVVPPGSRVLQKDAEVRERKREEKRYYRDLSREIQRRELTEDGNVVELTGQIALAKNRSAEARKKKLNRRAAKKMTAPGLFRYLEDAADFRGMRHYLTKTGKDFGQAKNFIKEAEETGLDLRRILDLLVAKWSLLATGNCTFTSGKMIHLPPAVEFSAFYKFRRDIIPWLLDSDSDNSPDGGGDDDTSSDVVISLDELAKRYGV